MLTQCKRENNILGEVFGAIKAIPSLEATPSNKHKLNTLSDKNHNAQEC